LVLTRLVSARSEDDMSGTPTWNLPLPIDGQTPWGEDYRSAMMTIDARLTGIRGSLFVEDNQLVTTISSQNVAVPAVLGNAQSGPPCRFCEVSSAGILKYIGPLDRVPTVIVTYTLESSANTTFALEIRKNGGVVAGSRKRLRLGPNVTIATGGLVANVEVSTNDELQVYVSNLTNTNDVTVLDLTMAARG
jgi:hypothetical protein